MQPTRVPPTTVLGSETPHNQSAQSGYRVNMAYVVDDNSPQPSSKALPPSSYQPRQIPGSAYSQRSLAVASEVPVNASSQHIQNLSFQAVADTTYVSRVDGRPPAPILRAPGFDYLNWKPYDKVILVNVFFVVFYLNIIIT